MPVGRPLTAVDRCIPQPERPFAFHFKSLGDAHDIDRVSAATRALAADRAIASLIRVRRVAVDAEADRTAATRAFETHRHLTLLGTLLGGRKVPWVILGPCFRHPSGEVMDRNSELQRRSQRFLMAMAHRTRRHRLHKTMAHLEAAVDLTQADWTGTTPLKNPGLLRRFFEGLPPGGNARHKGIAPLALQNRFAGGILPIDDDKGLRDLFDQRRTHVAVRRETAVAIARTGPYDPEALWGQSPLCLQGLDSPPTHSTGIVLVPADPLHDIALI